MKGQLNEQESPVLSIIIKKISEQLLEEPKQDSYQISLPRSSYRRR